MKKVFVLSVLFTSLLVQAQKTRPAKKKQPLLLGFQFSPDIANRTLIKNEDNATNDFIIGLRKDNEIAKLGYTFGLQLTAPCTEQLSFEIGIQYANKGYKTKKNDVINPSPGPDLPSKSQIIYRYNYLGIPIKAKFTMSNGTVRFIGGIGFQVDLLLQRKQILKLQYPNGRKERRDGFGGGVEGFRKIDVSPIVSAGVEFKVAPKIHLGLSPTFRYGAISVTDTPISERLWSLGLNIAVHYVLR